MYKRQALGLLYAISRAIFELRLDVHYAKVGTFLDQVVDVFYVTDASGGKLHDREAIQKIILDVTTTVEEVGRS